MSKLPFTPPLLPPRLDYASIFPAIVRARDIIARYDEAVKRLPNPELIQRSFETKEAVLSSKIEGTQATLEEIWSFDAQENQKEESEKERDYREIVNYRLAIQEGLLMMQERPLGTNLIKDLHKILLNSVRGQEKTPWEFRKQQVFIGKYGAGMDQATFIPPPPHEIPDLFSDLEKYLHTEDVVDPLVQIAIGHYQFEAIHPFLDGNGRVGRLLVPLFLYGKGITTYPNIYVSEFLEEHRDTYYELLRKVSEANEWIPWIQFFLEALETQTRLTLTRVTAIENLYRTLSEKAIRLGSVYAMNFLNALFVQPKFSVKSLKELVGTENNQTLYTLVEKFLQAGIIEDVTPEKERNKLYAFTALKKILQ